MKFMLGANYWGADYGTEMWRHYDPVRIREEMKLLAEYGVQCLRVFPNWRDFQPVEKAYGCRGEFGEYLNVNTGMPVYDDGVDPAQIENFRDFCHAADEYGIKLVVAIVTGWMSGRLYLPPVILDKNPIKDPEALMWMRRFIHRFVRELKNEKAIIMWDLGNECNCLGSIDNSFDGYVWTGIVRDSIVAEDNTRPVSSGMHGLCSDAWKIEHQGEITDVLTTHPYPSMSVGGDVEPYNRLRMTFLPTAQSLYYSGLSGKPAYIQESGTFSETIGRRSMSAQFLRIQVLSGLVNNLLGYQWWCAWEQSHLDFPPYSWCMIERQLGLFDKDRKPKPVALEMQKISKLVDALTELPPREVDGICLMSRWTDRQTMAIASLILAKQAGLSLDVSLSDSGEIPQSDLYFLPGMSGWQVMYRKGWDTIVERVQNGATLCITFEGGQITDFPALLGAESLGFMANTRHTAKLGDVEFSYSGKEILLQPTTAQVLAVNEEGNPVILKNKVGKGWIYFVNFSPETIASGLADGFNKNPYYEIYKMAGKDVLSKKILRTDDKNLGTTIHAERANTCLASVLNYSDKDIVPDILLSDGWKVKEVLYGNLDCIAACDGVILRLEK